MLRTANCVVVTNEPLARTVAQAGGSAFVLPDPLPSFPPQPPRERSSTFRVAVIATHAADEPMAEVIGAARVVGPEFAFSVTGDPAKLSEPLLKSLPPNVKLTGFLEEGHYWRLLSASDSVLDLTRMDNCLVCGAYEAIAVGVPAVLSNNAASVATFADFAEFTENATGQIAAALERVRARREELDRAIPPARRRFEERWTAQAQQLIDFMRAEA